MTDTVRAAVRRSDIAAAADRLASATALGVPCAPVRDLIGSNDLAAAYAVQAALTERRLGAGARIVGRKIGLTSKAVQQQLGVNQPDFGVLFDDMAYTDGDAIPLGRVLQPRVEAEIAFVLRSDLADGCLDVAQVRDAIDYGMAAIEVCGSRVAGWDISFGDTVADNASSGVFVLGRQRCTLDEFEPVDVAMAIAIDSKEVATGAGTACLGDPLEAVVWLARAACDLGEPLRKGQVILSGALGPMRPVTPGRAVTATISGLGSVSCTFSEGAK